MKKILFLVFALFSVSFYSQVIQVTPMSSGGIQGLIENTLINSPCIVPVNSSSTSGSSINGLGSFTNTNPNFPITRGVIMSSGSVASAPGPNNSILSAGEVGWGTDNDMESILGTPTGSFYYKNATSLGFNFTATTTNFSFDYVFSSEEYGNQQCSTTRPDTFVFILTDLTDTTIAPKNIAKVPGTNDPVSTKTIRDAQYNPACASSNAQYFGSLNPTNSATNFQGQTKLLTASATLIIGHQYGVKFVVADGTDDTYDSAIFISSDSFNIGQQQVLGPDLLETTDTALCDDQNYTIASSINAANVISWEKDGVVIPGQIGPSLLINSTATPISGSGTYTLTYTIPGGCLPITDDVIIEFYPQLTTPNPITINKCTGSPSYNLGYNSGVVSNGLNYTPIISYHLNSADAIANTNQQLINFVGTAGTTLFVRIQKPDTGCFVVKSFQIQILNPILNSQLNLGGVTPFLNVCSTKSSPNNSAVNFAGLSGGILGSLSPASNYVVSYHSSLPNASSGGAVITGGNGYALVNNNAVIFVRVQSKTDPSCFVTTSFIVKVNPLPQVDTLTDVAVCSGYALPNITNGTYWTETDGPNGTGIQLAIGDIITGTLAQPATTIYIYSQSTTLASCFNESKFKVTTIFPQKLQINTDAPNHQCGDYALPTLENGTYWTAPGGPTGGGTELTGGTLITTNQTIYFYFSSPESVSGCPIQGNFGIVITPEIDLGTPRQNYFNCSSFTLPPIGITGAAYYDAPGGTGNQLPVGFVVTPPGGITPYEKTIYVYADTGAPDFCPSEDEFTIFIGVPTIPNIIQCSGYALPALPIGNYFDGPGGTGTQYNAGDIITLTNGVPTKTFYVYVPPTALNCANNEGLFTITIIQPEIDTVLSSSQCDGYLLPPLNKGIYKTDSYANNGTTVNIADPITTTTTLFVYNEVVGSTPLCYNESPFTITIVPKAIIDVRDRLDVCTGTSIALSPLTNGSYYTKPDGPNGTGILLPAGFVINNTDPLVVNQEPIYIYNSNSLNCKTESSFLVNFYSITSSIPADQNLCDLTYTLPAQTSGAKYYSAPNGPQGTAPEGTPGNGVEITNPIISSTRSIWVYNSGPRGACKIDTQFNVTINTTPVLGNFPDVFVCEKYTLPTLSVGKYYTQPNGAGTELSGDITTSTTSPIYVYAANGIAPNLCKAEKSFNVTVYNVSDILDVNTCENYTLPALAPNTNYYSNSNGIGLINPITPITISQTIYIRGSSGFTTNCFDEESFAVTINPKPSIGVIPPANLKFCDDSDNLNDGLRAIDLNQFTADLVGTQTNIVTKYYPSLIDAEDQTNEITSPTILKDVFARLNNSIFTNSICKAIIAINITINKIPEPKLEDKIICVNNTTNLPATGAFVTFDTNLTTGHTFEWKDKNGIMTTELGSTFTTNIIGDYSVIATNIITGCVSKSVSASVIPSSIAITAYVVTQNFEDNQTIEVIATGANDDFIYSLDGGPFVESNIFSNLPTGNHIIIVRDKNGCGDSPPINVLIINFPKFFTPNGDTFNDTWNIKGLSENQKNAKITIFDRTGKLLKQISPNSNGWDGTYNGVNMPSSDYWFTVLYLEDGITKEFKSHFSMKR